MMIRIPSMNDEANDEVYIQRPGQEFDGGVCCADVEVLNFFQSSVY